MFVFKAKTILNEIKAFKPNILENCKECLKQSTKDLDLIKLADTKEDVLNILEEFHNNYAFSPNF